MKTVLLTGFDPLRLPIAWLTLPRMLTYALRHGLDFQVVRRYQPNVHPQWQCLDFILEAFGSGYERVMWMDCSVLIQQLDNTPWMQWDSGLYCPEVYCSALMVVHADSAPIINYVASQRVNPDWDAQSQPDIFLDRAISEEPGFRKRFHLIPESLVRLGRINPERWINHYLAYHPDEQRREINYAVLALERRLPPLPLSQPHAQGDACKARAASRPARKHAPG